MQHGNEFSTLKVAIVGAGPAGFYAAEALAALCPGCEVDLIERLPTPYGLIRSGVAPDHQTTKSIQQTFEQTASRSNLRFVGNVELDRDLKLEELADVYDAVVLACGAPHDMKLDIRGATLKGVYGASEFVGWYNAHPDHANLDPDLSARGAVIIGNGNVALDIARILTRPVRELASTDIAEHAIQCIAGSKLTDVHVVGRRGPLDAKFTSVELQELGHLQDVVAVASSDQMPEGVDDGVPPRERRAKVKNLECFRAFAEADPASASRRIQFQFNARPYNVLGTDRVEAVRFERTRVENGSVIGTGQLFRIPCGLIVTAIGYRARPVGELALSETKDRLRNDDGRIKPGLYVVGWLKRGPSGKIGTNRADGEQIAERIRVEVSPAGKPGFAALQQALRSRGLRWTDFTDWKAIERAEIEAAAEGAPRRKFPSIDRMLQICAAKSPAVASL
ncbi:FAD-dependent oxidoreductase [Bradyrhizobium sp. BR 1432]|uniref:FAD-dependent oxidoreductase n=1 Tax=Bradyrhizobium sp. BR 1432 TaxID=3447966 RepID=UPI003EE76251